MIAYPDKGAYLSWVKIADMLNKEGYNINVSDKLEKDEYTDGWDLVDVIEFKEMK